MLDRKILSDYDEALGLLGVARVKILQKTKRTKQEIEFLDEIDKRLNERSSREGKKLLKTLTKAIENSRKQLK